MPDYKITLTPELDRQLKEIAGSARVYHFDC